MTVTTAQLATYVGAAASDPALAGLVAVAEDMIYEYLADRANRVPETILDHAITQLASELWHRRNSPGGVLWGPDGDQSARLARDPMISVAPILAKYLGLGVVG